MNKTFNFEYELVRSDRRTLSAEVKKDGRVIVRAPRWTSDRTVEKFLSERAEWIEGHVARARTRDERYNYDRYTELEIEELKRRARETIIPLVEKYKVMVGVEPASVRINRAKGRFGSCSAKNTLNFSCFLMLYPIEAVEYVVVHELCHIKEHNHQRRFYREIEKVMADYRQRQKILCDAGYNE